VPASQAPPHRGISLLFDVFVLNQHLRGFLSAAVEGTGLRPDDYAVYSLLFESGPLAPTEMAAAMGMPLTTLLDYVRPMLACRHARRQRHPRDGRSYLVSLTKAGLAAFHRTSRQWNQAVRCLEAELTIPHAEIRRSLHALDDAVAAAASTLIETGTGVCTPSPR